jgi:hypothetical protein
MSFQPSIPLGGIAGWRFLQRTEAAQAAAFARGPQITREIAHFAERIGGVTSAEALVADRRLLQVALGAFGLEGEIDKKAFLRKVLESNTLDPRSPASRLTNPAFRAVAAAFGFGDPGGPRTADPGFAERIAAQYRARQFEVAVGAVDDDMRAALNFRREIAAYAARTGEGVWFEILGSPPLRRVFEKAFGLPKEFGKLDVDRQREILRDRTRATFGEGGLAVLRDPANVERLIMRFLARAQVEAGPPAGAPGSTALALLQGATGGAEGLFSLLAGRR